MRILKINLRFLPKIYRSYLKPDRDLQMTRALEKVGLIGIIPINVGSANIGSNSKAAVVTDR